MYVSGGRGQEGSSLIIIIIIIRTALFPLLLCLLLPHGTILAPALGRQYCPTLYVHLYNTSPDACPPFPTPNISPQVFTQTPRFLAAASPETRPIPIQTQAQHNTMPRSLLAPCLALLLLLLLPYHAEGRACQVRNYAGRPVNFYWMDVTNWGNYISQTKVPLPHATSSPLKTYETHRFFAAFADEAAEVPSWDPDSIPFNAQFVHRGFDQVVTALLNEEGQLYLDDWDIHEGEMTRLAQAISTCNETTSISEDEHAACVLAQAGVLVQSLERERDDIEALVSRMETRLDGAFCTGTGRFQTSAVRTFEWEGRQVDVLAETDNLTVFHFPAFLDASATETLLLSAPANGTRHVDIQPNPKLSFDASLAARQDWAQGFVNAQLGEEGGVAGGKEGGEEALHIFRYNKKEFHSPPCDGLCQSLPLHPSEYAATLLLYPQRPNQKAKDMAAWLFTTEEEGTHVGFTSQGDDAILFLYKKQEVGYVPALLPQLIPCPGTAEEMFVASRWIRRAGEDGEEGGFGDEL